MARLDVDHSEFTFVDYGLGKGRVLMLAAEYPFKRIVGVEFSESLDRTARQNLTKLGADAARVTTHVMDAVDYDPPEDRSSSTSSTRSHRRSSARCSSASTRRSTVVRGPRTSSSRRRPSSPRRSRGEGSTPSTSSASVGSLGACIAPVPGG